MRFFLILSIFLLIGCGKKELPASISSPLFAKGNESQNSSTSNNEASYFPNGIRIGSENDRIEIGKYGSFTVIKCYDANNILRAKIESATIEVYDYLGDTKISIGSNGVQLLSPAVVNCAGYVKTDSYFRVGNTQVLGPQQPAIEDASGQADIERKLNLLLEACREHGLIARGGTGPAHEQRR